MKKTISLVRGNTIVSLLLVVSMLFSLSSCGLLSKAKETASVVGEKASEIGGKVGDTTKVALSKTGEFLSVAQDAIVKAYGTTKDGVVYVYNEAADLTAVGYEKASAKATEVVGNVSEYVAALKSEDSVPPDVYATGDPSKPIKDLTDGFSFDETNATIIDGSFITEQFVAYYISSILEARGYEVYNGAVYYKGEIYSGLIFTDGEVFIEEDGQTIRSCGFVQLVSDDYSGVTVTDSMVQSGLIAVPATSDAASKDAFIVEEYSVFDDFSGIFNDTYFCLHQLNHYVLSISLKENDKANYDPRIELYDFDNEEYIYTAQNVDEVERLYVEDNLAFQGATATVNAIVDVEENSVDDLATVLFLDGNALDTLLSNASSGSESVNSFVNNAVKDIELGNNQFLSVDGTGTAHVLGVEDADDEARVTNGIISTVSSGLAAAGAVASIVCVAQAGTIVVTAIVITTGTCAIVYNVSNMLAGSQDIYYGAKGSDKESQNPVLNLFKSFIPDEQTATLIYHIWGASNTAISLIMAPITKAFSVAKVKGLNTFQTTVGVIRAAITTIAKAAATGVGSTVVANYVSKVVTKVSNNENIGRLAGFGACLVTGFIVYTGLDAIDRSLDISGLYPKISVKTSFAKAVQEQYQHLLQEDISTMSRGEKAKLVNSLVDEAMDFYGISQRPNVEIVYDSNVYDCGAYNPISDTLTINANSAENSTLWGLTDTIGHEMRHVWQWGEGYTDEMAYSLLNYKSPSNNSYAEYRQQFCEADAFSNALEFAKHIFSKFTIDVPIAA